MIQVHDSVRLITEDYIDRIHATIGHGRLHAGHAPSAQSTSIPSKYITIVTPNADRKGFNSKSKRFPSYPENANPGPGSYIDNKCLIKPNAISYSKKGFGGCATKERRCPPKLLPGIQSPGVGSYNVTGSNPDFNHSGVSRLFHAPVATKQFDPMRPKPVAPPPNKYEIKEPEACTRGAAQAAFKSTLPRINPQQAGVAPGAAHLANPAPWAYDAKASRLTHNAAQSVFKSKTKRDLADSDIELKRAVPGPGHYDPPPASLGVTTGPNSEKQPPNKKGALPRKHYLCISAPAMPLPAPDPLPGPGTYEVAKFKDPPKKYMSSPSFVSTVTRLQPVSRDADDPSPWTYEPNQCAKTSFHFNASQRWM